MRAHDACHAALRALPALALEQHEEHGTQALLAATDELDRDTFERVRCGIAKAVAAQRALDGKRARRSGMVRANRIEVGRVVAALVGSQGALILPKLTSSQMMRGTKRKSSSLREAFAAFQPLKMHQRVQQEVEHRQGRSVCGKAACEHGSTSTCMACGKWGRANGRVFECKHCGTRVLRDGQGRLLVSGALWAQLVVRELCNPLPPSHHPGSIIVSTLTVCALATPSSFVLPSRPTPLILVSGSANIFRDGLARLIKHVSPDDDDVVVGHDAAAAPQARGPAAADADSPPASGRRQEGGRRKRSRPEAAAVAAQPGPAQPQAELVHELKRLREAHSMWTKKLSRKQQPTQEAPAACQQDGQLSGHASGAHGPSVHQGSSPTITPHKRGSGR